MEGTNKKPENRMQYVFRALAHEAENNGDMKLAKEFRKAMSPNDLSKRAYKLYQQEVKNLEKDVNGE